MVFYQSRLTVCFQYGIKTNTATLGNICPICGKRFKPTDNANTMYCSEKCLRIANREMTKERMRKKRI